MYDARTRSRSPPDTLAFRIESLEQRVATLESTLNEIQADKRWWSWWYDWWGKWLQARVLRLWDVQQAFGHALNPPRSEVQGRWSRTDWATVGGPRPEEAMEDT